MVHTFPLLAATSSFGSTASAALAIPTRLCPFMGMNPPEKKLGLVLRYSAHSSWLPVKLWQHRLCGSCDTHSTVSFMGMSPPEKKWGRVLQYSAPSSWLPVKLRQFFLARLLRHKGEKEQKGGKEVVAKISFSRHKKTGLTPHKAPPKLSGNKGRARH